MELNTAKRDIDATGFLNTQKEFSIKNSALGFKILSDSLYSDKPLAVIRELSCNAYDAHVMAGTEAKPFDVHLPNQFEPFFSIRDYGIGLSNDDVLGLYTTYFESTKTMSNKAIGCLGLGSKSPFSYVDQFTITSWFQGKKSEYQAWINEDGVPCITLIKSVNSIEHNGIQIHMMVNASDFKAFAERARRFFHRFPTIPNITGNKDAVLTNVKYVLEGPNYKLRGNDDTIPYGEHKGAYAVQGVVAYPINAQNITVPLTQNQKELLTSMAIDIIFPIGELEVAPSREQLSYSKRTQENIVKALAEIEKHVPNHAKATLATAKNEFEARLLYNRWLREGSTESRFMRKVLGGKLTWNKIDIDSQYIQVDMYDKIKFDAIKPISWMNEDSDEFKKFLDEHKIDYFGSMIRYNNYAVKDVARGKKLSGQFNRGMKVDASYLIDSIDKYNENETQVVVVIADTPEINKNTSRFIAHNFGGKRIEVYVIKFVDGFEQKVKDQFKGFDGFISAKTLDIPPVEVKNKTAKADIRKLFKVSEITNSYYDTNLRMDESDYDVNLGGTYVVLYNSKVITPGQEWLDKGKVPEINNSEVAKLLFEAQTLGLIDPAKDNLYAFNTTHKNIVKKNTKWVSVFDLIKQRVQEKLKDKEFISDIENLAYFHVMYKDGQLFDKFVDFNTAWDIVLPLVNPKSTIHKFFTQATDSAKKLDKFLNKSDNQRFYNNKIKTVYFNQPKLSQTIESLDFITKYLGTKNLELTKVKTKAEKDSKQLNQLYPSLNTILQSQYSVVKEPVPIALYINMCDKTKSLIKSTLN